MKDLRNPLTRTENFEHPSGNIMKELTEAELNSVAAGAGVARNSGGIACTLTGECNIVQFTMPSGLHSVLERPFSEANGRPFLVKRSPLIVC